MQHVHEPEEFGVHVTAGAAADDSGMGRADVRLNGIVFVLIGLQLPYVMGQISGMSRVVLVEYGVGFGCP